MRSASTRPSLSRPIVIVACRPLAPHAALAMLWQAAAAAGDELAEEIRTGTPDSLLRNLAHHFRTRAAELRHQYGLDRPLVVQYVDYASHALRGDLGVALTVRADRFSKAARQKIEAAGGTVVELNPAEDAGGALGDAVDQYTRVRLYWSLARLNELRDEPAAALGYIRKAIALLEVTEDTLHLARAHLLCGTIMISQGKADEAGAQFDAAEQLTPRLAPHPTHPLRLTGDYAVRPPHSTTTLGSAPRARARALTGGWSSRPTRSGAIASSTSGDCSAGQSRRTPGARCRFACGMRTGRTTTSE